MGPGGSEYASKQEERKIVRRGALYWINLGTTSPPDSGKTRPGLVVSNSVQNSILDSVVMVPLSTIPDEIWPLRLKLQGANEKSSYAVLPGIRQVSKARLTEFIAFAPSDFMIRMDEALALYLND